MIRALSIGEKALRVSTGGSRGRVTRVFREAAYIWFGSEMIVAARGGPRSQFSVNLETSQPICDLVAPGDECVVKRQRAEIGSLDVRVEGAELYRGGPRSFDIDLPADRCLLRSASTLRMLYDVSESSQMFLGSGEFSRFLTWLLREADEGGNTFELERYAGLIGLGPGFTPAGDDFLGGFLATFNQAPGSFGLMPVKVPFDFASARTHRESAALMNYSQEGILDESVERQLTFLLSGREECYFQELLAMAPRGHTSGLDTSLGILFCAAFLAERERGSGIAKRVVSAVTGRLKQFK